MNLSFSNLLLYIHRSKTETEHSWYHYESENLSCLIKLEKLHFNFMLFRYVYEGVHMCVCARVCVRACVGVRASACVYVHVLTTISTNKIQWLEGKKKKSSSKSILSSHTSPLHSSAKLLHRSVAALSKILIWDLTISVQRLLSYVNRFIWI